ncbi:hypothetical protein L1049_011784 [Liquidambar formosana]|uniref:SAC3/GANP/THP3 conserved domain-containing protein n=1 Tax=Liquidambar formosana TaxID=63359 RepID=A0AAP0WYB9_LIQFO
MDKRSQRRNASSSTSFTGSSLSGSHKYSRPTRNATLSNPNPRSATSEGAYDSKSRSSQQEDSHDLPSIVGTCPSMCPARERAQRERLRDLAVFERLYGNPGKTSPSIAVKKNYIHQGCASI